jgi:uracil-DNA glycosylase family 4
MQGSLTGWLSSANKRLEPPVAEEPVKKKSKPEKLFTTAVEYEEDDKPPEEHLRQTVSEEEIEERLRLLKEIKNEMKSIYLPLKQYAVPGEKIVFHRGSPVANLMIVGEGPGQEEAYSGKPFVGKSGILLDKYLAKNNIKRDEHIYVTNLVKYHPPKNRDPTYSEIAAEIPYLIRQILIVRPKVILCLGRLSSTILSNHLQMAPYLHYPESDAVKCLSMWDIYWNESNLQAMRLSEQRFTCYIYRAYHPSAILRDKSATAEERRNYVSQWREDFKKVVGKLIFPALRYFDASVPHGWPARFPTQQYSLR